MESPVTLQLYITSMLESLNRREPFAKLQEIIDGSTVNYYECGDKNNGTIVCFHGLR